MKKFARKCDCCGKLFNEGYCIGGGEQYFCSGECLAKSFSPDEITELELGEDTSDSYWTSWEDIEDFQYFEDGSEVDEE